MRPRLGALVLALRPCEFGCAGVRWFGAPRSVPTREGNDDDVASFTLEYRSSEPVS